MKEGKSLINHYPRRDNVILKRTIKTSLTAINGAKDIQSIIESKDARLISLEVVAIGNQVEDLELNDIVTISYGAVIQEIAVEGNDKDFDSIRKYVRSYSKDLTPTDEFDIVNYFKISEFGVDTIINRKRDSIEYNSNTTAYHPI